MIKEIVANQMLNLDNHNNKINCQWKNQEYIVNGIKAQRISKKYNIWNFKMFDYNNK